MSRQARPIARVQPLTLGVAYGAGLWLAGWALATSVHLIVAQDAWRRIGVPALASMPLLAAPRNGPWPALAWRVLGSALMALPVARATGDAAKGNP